MSDRNRPSLFGASALYLLASAGLWLVGLILAPQIPALFPGLSTEQLNLLINLCYYLPFLFFPVALWASRRNGALRLNPLPLRLMVMSDAPLHESSSCFTRCATLSVAVKS